MKLAALTVAASAAAVHAQSSAAPASSVAPAGSSAAVSGAASSGAPNPALSSVSFSLASINPTAVPLASISPGTLTTQQTLQPTATYSGGTVPTFLPNAPPLPDISTLSPANYPPLDKPPPVDSPEVLQWIKEVQNSGITIPQLEPTQPGGCAANPQFAQDSSRCWWTCGGCTRDGDITACPEKYTWGLTYDDGPAPYTPNLLSYLDQNQLKTTFFAVGSRCISYPNLLREEYMAQHQIAVHTWSHPAMTTVSTEGIIAELGWSKKIIKDVLGVTPIYWRPPYGDIDDRVRAIAKAMGLEAVMWTRISPTATFDTDDYNVAGGTVSVSQVLQNWEHIIGNASQIDTGFIVLEHDLFVQTVDLATGYILPAGLANQPKLNIKPVISCLNKPLADAYLETNDNATNPLPTASNVNPTLSSGAAGAAQGTGNASGNSSNGNSAMGVRFSASGAFVMAGTAALAFVAWMF